jgi:HSP20 family protein
MAMVGWNNLREMQDMAQHYLRAARQPQAGSQSVVATGDWAPLVDIVETAEAFVIKAEIPEVDREDVKVTVDNGVLTIRGERKQEKEDTGIKIHRVERSYGIFARSFTLPDNVDETKITVRTKKRQRPSMPSSPILKRCMGIRFKKVKKYRYNAPCPFHADTNESFMVYVNKKDDAQLPLLRWLQR